MNQQLDANLNRHLAFIIEVILLQDKDILKKAQELLDEDISPQPLTNPDRQDSYEEETQFSGDKSLEMKESLEREESNGEPFNIPKQGYQRFPRYKKPGVLKILGGIVVIIALIVLISMLMPYIPQG